MLCDVDYKNKQGMRGNAVDRLNNQRGMSWAVRRRLTVHEEENCNQEYYSKPHSVDYMKKKIGSKQDKRL